METVPSSGGGGPSSIDSSPRSSSWDDPFPSPAVTKHRLMCSYGGRIVPRPTDKSLCYLGGETRMVVVDPNTSLADLAARLSSTLLAGRPFTLKYQLPHEDLDSLVSVTTDEDLDNMLDEAASSSSRLRLFLFPSTSSNPASATSSIGSLIDDSKSETWFVDALNSTIPRSDAPPRIPRPDSSGKLARHAPEGLDNSSSFGSTCSAPSVTNLPPIRTRVDEQRVEEQLAHINLAAAVAEGQEMLKANAASVFLSPGPVARDEDRSDHVRLPTPPLQQKASPVKAPVDDATNRPMYYQDTSPPAADAPSLEPKHEMPIAASSYHGYLLPQNQPEQLQQQQQYYQQSQQFIQPNPHYVPTSSGLPVPSYYHPIQQSQQYDSHVPMYFMPMRPTSPYNLASVQPGLGDAAPAAVRPAVAPLPSKGEVVPNFYRPAAATGPTLPMPPAPLVRLAGDQAQPYPSMGYPMMHQHPSQTGASMANYGYEYSDPSQQSRMYFTQNTSPPTYAPQYQTMVSSVVPDVTSAPQLQPGELKHTRA